MWDKKFKCVSVLVAVMHLICPCFSSADDLEIFGGALTSVRPNVLIIFDTSGSMSRCTDPNSEGDCPDPYDSRVYVAKSAIHDILYDSANENVKFGLMTFNGDDGGQLLQPCGSNVELLNSAVMGITPSGRTPLAETLAEAGLYFAGKQSWFMDGSTAYNTSSWYQNSHYNSPVEYDCQKNYVVLMTDGDPTGDNDARLYQSNYIKNTVIGDYDGDSNNSEEQNTMDFLDDVAYYLSNTNDFNSPLTTLSNGSIDVTPIRTYTIGFSSPATVTGLLTDTADNGGGEYYSASTASALQDAFNQILSNVNETNAIYAAPAIPRKPDNQVEAGDKAYMAFFKPQADGRWIGNLKGYGILNGTLMDSRSTTATPLTATDANGLIKSTARSYWDVDNTNDALEVVMGGAGEVLKDFVEDTTDGIDRNVLTYTDVDVSTLLSDNTSEDFYQLKHQKNQFKLTNNQGLDTLIESIYSSSTPSVVLTAEDLINKVLNGTTITLGDGTTTAWYLGDIVHSAPLVANFPGDCTGGTATRSDMIFVGANDGMLHAFCASNGRELWGFIPPTQLGNLNKLGDGEHHYLVDGSPVMTEVPVDPNADPVVYQKVLIFGEGRGGQRYYALDFTAGDNPTQPHWRYQVHENVLNDSEAVLGQSWATPQPQRVQYWNTTLEGVDEVDVFLLTGGYDPRYEEGTFPGSLPQSPEIQGRALYTVNASTGTPVGLNLNGGNWAQMEHSIVAVTGFDAADKGYMDRVYAGDLGGNLLAASYNKETYTWEKLALLTLPDQLDFKTSLGTPVTDNNGDPVTGTIGRKIMTQPEVTLETDGECVYFGTGDREHLLDESATDVFYAVCHNWEKQIDEETGNPVVSGGQYVYQPVFPADTNGDTIIDASDKLGDVLVDVTDNLIQGSADASERATITSSLASSSGWYLRMEHAGEKITSSPKIIDGKIYFTTFTPEQAAQNQDPCTTSHDLGTSRLYAIDYRTGVAVFDFDTNTSGLTKEDRSLVIGTSVAYDPVLVTSGLETTLVYGSGGKFQARDVEITDIIKRYYWRQVK